MNSAHFTPQRRARGLRSAATGFGRTQLGYAILLFALGVPSASVAAPPAGTLTRAPELLEFVAAEIPLGEQARTASVAVVLKLRVDPNGAVGEAVVSESSGSAALDRAAIDAAVRFRFRPAEIDGVPAPIRIAYRYVFSFRARGASRLVGRVIERGSGRPLSGVIVTVTTGETVRSSTTAPGGTFAFAVPAGPLRVRLEGPRLTPVETQETIGEEERLEVEYALSLIPLSAPAGDGDDLELVVTAPATSASVVTTRVSAEEARKVPGTSGDVLRVVESLPGVARASVGSGALVVWGASPDDTRIYVDGVPVPRLYHEGGLRSIVHPEFVESIELIPGGAGPTYGRNLGGTVAVRTVTEPVDSIHGTVAADLLDTSLTLKAPIAEGVVLAGAARLSLLDHWAEAALGADVAEFVPIPRYRDGQLRLVLRPNARDRVDVVLLGSSDRFARGTPNPDPALRTRESRGADFGRLYLKWTREDGQGGALAVVPWLGLDHNQRETRFGSVSTRIGATSLSGGLRLSYRKRLSAVFTAEAGLDAEFGRHTLDQRGSIGLPSREGDIRAFGQPPPDRIAADDWVVHTAGIAPYVELQIEPLKGLVLSPGLRLDPYFRSVSRRLPREGDTPELGAYQQNFAAEPRLALRYQVLDPVTLRGAFALNHQLPAREDLSATFGTPVLPTARATHWVFGGDLRLAESIALELTGFWVQSERLAMRDASASPLRARALVPSGVGRNFGVQALLRRQLASGLSGWIAYTFMRSDRRDRPGESFRASDYEQAHVFTTVLSYTLPFGIEAGLRFRVATGFPRTEVRGAVYDAARDRYQPLFGLHNRDRIPTFVQLDARVAKAFHLGVSTLEVSLEVLNVTDQNNAEEFVFAPDFSRRDTVRGLPILPVLGAKWSF